ncbi:hypothetical protein GF412_01195 [Candidatus Micrarchaeota archaeon]|nr:hypothetical protein [Candidatus Micrarchaeota archaeon]MBD3417588.1 hypothetical protein [Candidatus Micrarchaeota archaeon]
MGEGEVAERWAYGGDSMAARGYVRKGSRRNTDIGTKVSEFTGGKIKFDNYGKSGDTTGGMLGRYRTGPNKKREDRVGQMLEGDYDGIIIEVGVNDISARGGGSRKHWKKVLGRMRGNIVEMYVRAFIKGAGTGNRAEVLGKIDSAIRELEKKQGDIGDALGSGRAKRRGEAYTSRLEMTREDIKEKISILEDAREAYLKHARDGKPPGKKVGRIVFVEGAPWKGHPGWERKEGLRTLEYNRMLKVMGFELNKVFGELEGPTFEVAEIYDALVSKDGMQMQEKYAGQKRGGKDYLHFGEEGREVAAAVIASGHFPNHVEDRVKVGALAKGETHGQKQKSQRMLAVR